MPKKPLELWGYESSPFTKVREHVIMQFVVYIYIFLSFVLFLGCSLRRTSISLPSDINHRRLQALEVIP